MYENSKELIVLVSQQCIYNINMNVKKYKKKIITIKYNFRPI